MTTRAASGPRRRGRGLLAIVLLLPLLGGIAATAAPATPVGATPTISCPRLAVPAGLDGIVPDRSPSACAATPGVMAHGGPGPLLAGSSGQLSYNGGDPPLLYGGGPVVGTADTTGENTVHPLFWAPSGYSFPAGYEAGIDTYLTDVAAADGTASDVYAVATQYTDGLATGSPHIRYDVHAGTPVTITAPYPASGGCIPDSGSGETYTACVTDDQMHSELSSVLSTDGLPAGLGDVYLLVFPPNVETCAGTADAAGGGVCSDTAEAGFCAYHSAFQAASGVALYANIPFPTGYRYTCIGTEAPSGSPALDSTLSVISHEHNETITDPLGDAWIDGTGNEEADECAWDFGSALGGPAGAEWNQAINGHHYELQQEFSNEDYTLDPAGGCALTQTTPTASLDVTTAHPVAGLPVGVDGADSAVANVAEGIAAWSWEFGDGSPISSGAVASHVYASAGTYTVTLTVTDTDGFTATASAPVKVAAGSPPAFTSAAPPWTGSTGTSYSYTFAASGDPVPTYSLDGAPGWLGIGASTGTVSGTPPAGTTSFTYSVSASNGIGPSAGAGPFTVAVSSPAGHQAVPDGYWLVGADGGIFSFGSAGFFGSTGSLLLQRPVVGIAPTADRHGYWLVASDGGVFAFGDAGYHGSLPGLGIAPAGSGARSSLAAPIVAMVPSTDDAGYFMVAADGGVFAFGDARFAGSCPGIGGCSGAAVAVMPDATGDGYWLVTATGAVYAFGDAPYQGASPRRNVAVTSAVRTPDGGGYWVLFADGQVTGFGDAGAYGDPMGDLGSDTATALFATADGGGYWVATSSGAVHAYGDATADGSMAGTHLNAPIIAASGW